MSTCSEWFRHVFRKGKLQAPNALQCAALPAFGFASEAAGWVSTQTSCLEKQHVTFDQHLISISGIGILGLSEGSRAVSAAELGVQAGFCFKQLHALSLFCCGSASGLHERASWMVCICICTLIWMIRTVSWIRMICEADGSWKLQVQPSFAALHHL